MPAHVRLRGRVFINGAWLYEARGVREFRSQVNRPLGCARSRSRGATPHGADLHRILALPLWSIRLVSGDALQLIRFTQTSGAILAYGERSDEA
jgi:hypothetical protein